MTILATGRAQLKQGTIFANVPTLTLRAATQDAMEIGAKAAMNSATTIAYTPNANPRNTSQR